MKKTLVLIALLAIIFGSFAQRNFQLGLHFSPNIGWLKPNGSNTQADGSKIGYTFGVIGDFNITENYIFSTGLGITNTGFSLVKPDAQTFVNNLGAEVPGYGKTTSEIRLNYVDIPLTLKLRTNEIGYMKYYGKVGFGVGVNYGSQADEKFSYTTNNSTGAVSYTHLTLPTTPYV